VEQIRFLLRPGDDSKITFDQAQQSDCFDEPTSAILRVSYSFFNYDNSGHRTIKKNGYAEWINTSTSEGFQPGN
jgi:hypothetical protein